jgi:hypothetical protein
LDVLSFFQPVFLGEDTGFRPATVYPEAWAGLFFFR